MTFSNGPGRYSIFGYLFAICGGKNDSLSTYSTCYDVFDMLHTDLKIAKKLQKKVFELKE